MNRKKKWQGKKNISKTLLVVTKRLSRAHNPLEFQLKLKNHKRSLVEEKKTCRHTKKKLLFFFLEHIKRMEITMT